MGEYRDESGNITYDGFDNTAGQNVPDEAQGAVPGIDEFVPVQPEISEEDRKRLEKEQEKLAKKAAKEQAAAAKKAAREQAAAAKKAAKEQAAAEKAGTEGSDPGNGTAEDAAEAPQEKKSVAEICKTVLFAMGRFFAKVGKTLVKFYRKIRKIEDINAYDLDNAKPGRKSRQLRRYTKIRWKLMAAFILPVILIVVLGLVSYNMASETVISKCNLSVSSTMSATDKYLKLMLTSVKNKAATLSTDADVTNYYYNLYDRNITDQATKKAYNGTYNSMGGYIKQTDYLEDYYILCNQGRPTFSYKKTEAQTRTATPEMFMPYWDTEEAKPFAEGKSAFWTLSHPFIDETFWGEPDSYCMTFVRLMKNKDGVIAFDISTPCNPHSEAPASATAVSRVLYSMTLRRSTYFSP